MSLAHTLAVFEALDSPRASGDTVRGLLDGVPGIDCNVEFRSRKSRDFPTR